MAEQRTFRERLETAPSYGFAVITIQGDSNLMLPLHTWALEQRAAGVSMAIFLTKDGLTIHTPIEHWQAAPPLAFLPVDRTGPCATTDEARETDDDGAERAGCN